MKNLKTSTSSQAFSLVELLVVITIIGILASMSAAVFGPAREGAEEERNRRNAQEIASTAAMASAAGAKFVIKNNTLGTIENLVQGRSAMSGVFKGRVFKTGPMQSYQIQGAMKYLALNDSELVYNHQ